MQQKLGGKQIFVKPLQGFVKVLQVDGGR